MIRLRTQILLSLTLVLTVFALVLVPETVRDFMDLAAAVMALYTVTDYVVDRVEEISRVSPGLARAMTVYVVPWITTGPETITTIVLASAGLTGAALWNGFISALFDFTAVVYLAYLATGPRLAQFRKMMLAFLGAFTIAVVVLHNFMLDDMTITTDEWYILTGVTGLELFSESLR